MGLATKQYLQLVITSYSIHYTKLYDMCLGCVSKPDSPQEDNMSEEEIGNIEDIKDVEGLWLVITSYSIHYTKLYEIARQ